MASARKGRLRPGTLLDVLREVVAEGITGVVHLTRHQQELSLRTVNGQIVSGSAGPARRLGDILVGCGFLSRFDLEAALLQARTEGRRLGPVLSELDLVSRDRVEEALRLQVRDVIFTALVWPDGAWHLERDDPTPLPEDATFQLSTAQLLREAEEHLQQAGIVPEPAAPPPAPPPPAPPPPVPSPRVTEQAREIETVYQGLAHKSHFEVLGIARGSSPDEIKAAYVMRARKFHPDTLGGQVSPELEEKARAVFMRVLEAYQILRGTSSRARYEEASVPARPLASSSMAGWELHAPREAPAPMPAIMGEAPPLLADVLKEAEEHLAADRPWEASVALEELLTRANGPLRLRAHLLLARALAKTPSGGRRAETELKALLVEDPANVEGTLALAQLYAERGMEGRAESMFRDVLVLDPQNARATRDLASLGSASAIAAAGTGRRGPRGVLDRFVARARV